MKKFFALVAVGLLILGAASCDTKNIGVLPGANTFPTIDNLSYAAPVLTVTVTDFNNDPVTVTVSEPAGLSVDATSKVFSATGNVTFTFTADVPAVGGGGVCTVTISDGRGGTATGTINVTIAATGPSAPVIGAVAFADNVLTVPVTDANGDNVTVSVSAVAGLTVDNTSQVVAGGAGNAVFTWSGAVGANGTTTITADDGGLTDTATQLITITPGPNNAPVIGAVTFVGGVLTVPVTDADGNNVNVTVTVPAGLAVDNTTMPVAGGNGNAVFNWTAVDAAAGGTGDTTITADDGAGGTDTATQTITFPPNAAPVIGAVTYVEATGTLTVPVTDADGDDVTVSVSAVAGMTPDAVSHVVNGGNGSAVFVWTGNGTGDTTITAADGNGGMDTATQTITLAPPNAAPEIGAVAYAAGVLTVPVTDADGGAVAVTVTIPTGFAVDNTTVNVNVPGDAVFNWSATDFFAGANGTTDITADDGAGGTDTASQLMDIPVPGPFNADTLYAFPASTTAAVGAPVTVYVITGDPANDLQFLSSVGFTVGTAGTYVANSFNVGMPGGARTDTDGYWGTMGPPAPANGQYLDLGDALMPGAATDIGGGVHRYNFAVVTQGPFAAPAAFTNGVLFSFQVSFSAAGAYPLGFQLNDGVFDQTYYSDQNGTNFFWGTLDNSYTITVN